MVRVKRPIEGLAAFGAPALGQYEEGHTVLAAEAAHDEA